MVDTGFEPVATTVSRQCSTTELIAPIEEFLLPLIRKQQVAFHFLSNLTFHRSLLVISKFRISINPLFSNSSLSPIFRLLKKMKLNQIINLHKGLTAFVVVGLMILFDNFTIAPYVYLACLLYTSPSPRDGLLSRMPSSA